MIGNRVKVPYMRDFPIWRYGPIYSKLDGTYLRDGWYPEVFGERTYRTIEDARREETARAERYGYPAPAF